MARLPTRLLFWRRWSPARQNLRHEIDAAKKDTERTDLRDPDALERCRSLLEDAESAFDSCFSQELFVWSTLAKVNRDMLLLVPADELLARMTRMELRLAELRGTAAKQWKAVLKSARRVLQNSDTNAEPRARAELQAFSDFLDDRLISEIWWSISIRRFSTFFALIGIVAIVLLIWLIHPLYGATKCACADSYTPWAMAVSGLIGGLLSAISAVRSKQLAASPPLASVHYVRPVIGAMAGLLVFFMTPFVDVEYPALYAVAIALGFTERTFFGALNNLAGRAESQIGSNLGLGDRPSQRGS